MVPLQPLRLQFMVDLIVMPMKKYSSFPKARELEPDARAKFSVKPRTLVIFYLKVVPLQVLSLQVIVDLGVLPMKRYFIFLKRSRIGASLSDAA